MIDYKGFIEDYFLIIDPSGKKVPFVFNDIQDKYYNQLREDYTSNLTAVRENILKARREGFSSLLEGIFMTDFILSGLGQLPVISGQIVSHKAEEVTPHIKRSNLFLDSYLDKEGIKRSDILKTDNSTYIESTTGAEYFVGTAGAKTLGRGGTLQNLHWTEVAFYPNTDTLNAENIVMPAEQQVGDGIGKIFRESTGNTLSDFFAIEYQTGKEGLGEFKSRFFPWFMFSEYRRIPPKGFSFTQAHLDFMNKHNLDEKQMYWYIKKVLDKRGVTDKGESKLKRAKREYPTTEIEAFLVSGDMYFDSEAVAWYHDHIKEAIKTDLIYV